MLVITALRAIRPTGIVDRSDIIRQLDTAVLVGMAVLIGMA